MEDTKNIPLVGAKGKASYGGRHCMWAKEAESNYHICVCEWVDSTFSKKRCLARRSFLLAQLYFPSPCSPIKYRGILGSAASIPSSPETITAVHAITKSCRQFQSLALSDFSCLTQGELLHDWYLWLNGFWAEVLISSNKSVCIPPSLLLVVQGLMVKTFH